MAVPTEAAQLVFITAASLVFATVQTVGIRYSVIYVPPEFFGTFMGVLFGGCGVFVVALNVLLESLPGESINKTAACMFLSLLCMCRTLYIFHKDGVPPAPPKNRYTISS